MTIPAQPRTLDAADRKRVDRFTADASALVDEAIAQAGRVAPMGGNRLLTRRAVARLRAALELAIAANGGAS